MELSNYIRVNKKLQKEKYILIIVSIVLLTGNFLLTGFINRMDSKTILIPNHLSTPMWVKEKEVSEEYLEAIARDITHMILNVTPQNYEYVERAILKLVHPSSYGEIKQQLQEYQTDVRIRQVSINFRIKQMIVTKELKQVEILGEMESKVGLRIVRVEKKRYRMVFDNENSIIKLKEFYEVKDEQL